MPRAQESTVRCPGKRGLTGKQARRPQVEAGDERQASSMLARWAVGFMRRGGLTLELWVWQQNGRRKAALPSSIVRKGPSFPDGLPPRPVAVWSAGAYGE